MEFGPRALGHRSILADARSATVQGRINGMVKERAGFRPFAPAVLAVPLHEASLKTRAGGPVDDQPDIDAGYWAGHIPLRTVASAVVPDPGAPGPVPDHVVRRVGDFP